MSALGVPVLINPNRAYWLSSIGSDVIHSTIVVDELDANTARVSTLIAENIEASTMNLSTLNLQNLDVSGMYVSSIRGNTAFFSSMTLASDLSGGVGYVRFSVDASGIQVDGDPIRFDNLVYLTSTINIVQVSTIVDTDIFAQRGFFSTLSSGVTTGAQATFSSIICNDISGLNGSFGTLFVSTLEALDISGVASGKNWSLYPTLNSSITFQPGFVLSNVGPSLFFAGVEITDVSGGGQDWSRFPAVSTVQMNNNSMTGLSTLQYQDGSKLYSVTGNNLFYNAQQITTGAGGAASNWAQYPANNNVNLSGSNLSNAALLSGSNLALTGSNVTNGNTFTNSLGVGGLSLVPLASINSLGQGVLQDLDVGNTTTAIGDLNVYGNFALAGDNALYVIGGTTLTGGLTGGLPVHGTEIGAAPVAGIDTMRIDVLPVGIGINAATYVQVAAAGAGSFAAGGSLSLAGGDYVEINTDDCRIVNTTSGNQSTTLTVANIQMPASVAATVPLQINNTSGGGINLVGTPGVGQIAGFSSIAGNNIISPFISTTNINLSTINGHPFSSIVTPQNIDCSNINVSASTNTDTLRVNFSQHSTMLYSLALGVSSVSADHFGQRVWVSDSVIGATNIGPIDARIYNFSSIQSGTMSTINLTVSTINGLPWDISGGSAPISSFQTLQTSSIKVSSLSGTSGTSLAGSTIFVEGGLQFFGGATGLGGAGSRFLSSLREINTAGDNLSIIASTLNLLYPDPNSFVRIGGGGAFDTHVFNFAGAGAVSTGHLFTSSIIGNPVEGLDISGNVDITGGLFVNDTIEIPLATGGINFDDGSGINYTRMMRRDIANNNMLSVVNTPALSSNNLVPLAVGELWLTGGADQYQAVRIYSQFPYGNYEFDVIDADGATLFAYMQGYQNPDGLNPGFLQAYSNVSSISGYDQDSAANQMLHVINGLTTSNLIVSSINGAAPGGGGGTVTSSFTSLFTSSFQFSTATSYMSNALYNYPVFVEADHAMNISTGGVAIAVQGHNLSTGSVRNQLEFGARATGENYIMASWPGQNLEDLYIDATEVIFRDGVFSTIINLDPYGLITTGAVSAPSLLVSSINGNNAQPAFTNNLCLSTLDLFAGSTTLVHWSTVTTSSNINTSDYDIVVGENGTYKFGVSLQMNNKSGVDAVEFFFLKNDTPINYSGSIQNVPNNVEEVVYAEIIEQMNNGDKMQVGLFTNSADLVLSTMVGNATISPGAILTAYKIV